MRLAVVVPFFNEEASIGATLRALAAQTDMDFHVVLVDNGSTDESRRVITEVAGEFPALRMEVIAESEKGTGSAADTGFRYAIALGAEIVLRTDADCVPHPEWVGVLRAAIESGELELVAGRIRPRSDEIPLRRRDRALIPPLVAGAAAFGALRKGNRGAQFRTRFRMVAGNNMAITADLYVNCGGFPRTRIEETHEDRELVNRARMITARIGTRRSAVVYNSVRRLHAWGYVRTLLWYWDHKYRPERIDIRLPPPPARDALVARADTSSSSSGRQVRARLAEARLYLASHPVAYGAVRTVAHAGPVVRIPRLGVCVNDPALIRGVLSDTATFSKGGHGSAGAVLTQVLGPYALLNTDGDTHVELRRRIGSLFSPTYLEAVAREVLEPQLQSMRSALGERNHVDLVHEMRVLTGRVICHQIGLQPHGGSATSTYTDLYELGERLVSVMQMSTVRLTAHQVREAQLLYAQFESLVAGARARGAPPSSLVVRLAACGLSPAEIAGVAGALFLTGTQTVTTALPRIVATLLDTGQFAAVRRDPTLIGPAIDEGLRLTVPSPMMLRGVESPGRIGNVSVRPGDRIILLTCNAARHRPTIPRAGRFELGRRHPPDVRHLWFGYGARFCLGYPLARLELESVLAVLAALPDELRIIERRAARRVLLPAYSRLVVRAGTRSPLGAR